MAAIGGASIAGHRVARDPFDGAGTGSDRIAQRNGVHVKARCSPGRSPFGQLSRNVQSGAQIDRLGR
jgi:hypothetical protein